VILFSSSQITLQNSGITYAQQQRKLRVSPATELAAEIPLIIDSKVVLLIKKYDRICNLLTE
jgi:hypothetical protein